MNSWTMPSWLSVLCIASIAGVAATAAVADPSPLASHLPTPNKDWAIPSYDALSAPLVHMREGTPWNSVVPNNYTCNTMVRLAPPGYGWKSIPVDSGCTIHLLRDSKLFQHLRPRSISIRTASNVTELARQQGAAVMYAYTDKGVQAPIMLHDAAHAPQMADLMSVS